MTLPKHCSSIPKLAFGSCIQLREWRIIAKLLLVALAFVGISPAFAGSATSCVKGTPEPKSPIIPKMRPIQTAQCSYSFDEFVRRLTTLAADTQSVDSVETLESAFGLPAMITGYDDIRIAAYAMDISGEGGWKVRLGASEGFYPTNKGPARFVPGPHPRRLDSVTKAALHIDVQVSPFRAAGHGEVSCVPLHAFEQVLGNAGWTRPTPGAALDGVSPDAMVFQYANKHASIGSTCSKQAPQQIQLWQEPAKP